MKINYSIKILIFRGVSSIKINNSINLQMSFYQLINRAALRKNVDFSKMKIWNTTKNTSTYVLIYMGLIHLLE